MNSNDQFSPDELGSIQSPLQEFDKGQLEFHHPAVIVHTLTGLWQIGEAVSRYSREVPLDSVYYKERRAVPKQRDWDLGLSSEFRKAIRSLDRRLQGRIPQALDYITTKPTVARGDTVKPLKGEFEGLCRYRIGDYRLLYRPETDSKRVVLVTFVSRGSAYA